jgi:hypothetical protein
MKKTAGIGIPKTEIDSDVIQMLSKQGFIDLFWQRLQDARKTDSSTSQETVFNALNDKYLAAIGCKRYSNYECFRKVRDKK